MKKSTTIILYVFGSGLVFGFIGLLYTIFLYMNLPKINNLTDYNPPVPSTIYSRDGEPLMELAREKREVVRFDEIPKLIVDAFLSAEDDNFYNHKGVDYLGIVRAMIANIKAGRVVQGGSTITQQVAKSLLLSREKTITRKIKDLLLALKIEKRFTKQEILFLYLNQVYLGGGYYGVKKAFSGYFGKELEQATVAESALVAGLLVAPGRYSPYINPKYAKIRQRYVLKRMFTTGKITEEQYQQALEEEIQMRLNKPTPMKAKYFTDWIRQRVIKRVGKEEFLTQGYEVVTTLDMKLQEKAEKAIKARVEEIDKRQGFKGPLRRVDEIGIALEEEKVRREIYEDESEFFTFMPDGVKVPEHEFSEEELVSIKEKHLLKNELLPGWFVKRNGYTPGYLEDDKLVTFFKKDRRYEAVVTGVSDSMRIIFVSLGGAPGIIPEKFFTWAHRRVLSTENKFQERVTRPSKILKRGDVIHVTLDDYSEKLWKYVDSSYKARLQNKEALKQLKTEKYLLFKLDQVPDVQASLLALKPNTGEIISLVGGYDFDRSQFNRALDALRQPGSAFKPIIYAAGLENGFTPASILMDSPESLESGQDFVNWKPRNYDGEFKGPMTFRESLELSRNVPTIRLTMNLGVQKLKNFAERINLNAEMPKDLSISLGSFGVTLLDLVRTYAIFPNKGKIVEPKSIISLKDRYGVEIDLESEEGEEEEKSEEDEELITLASNFMDRPEKKEELVAETVTASNENVVINPFLESLDEVQVYDKRLAYIMTQLLRGVVQNGTGRGARLLSAFLGGKTGTTNNYVDAWFIGFSSNLVTGVWTGFDDNTTLGWPETGSQAALPIWKDFMEYGIRKYGEYDFPVPEGIINVKVDKKTGKPYVFNKGEPFVESFVAGTEPGAEESLVESKEEEQTHEFEESNTILGEEDYFTIQ
jgi:penicillin-binding protein 1A